MRRVARAFAIGLGVGLSITAVRVVVRARRGLPTTWAAGGDGAPGGANSRVDGRAGGRAANGHAAGPNGQAAGGQPGSLGPAFTELLDRLRAALADGAQAMRDTEAELRSTVFGGR